MLYQLYMNEILVDVYATIEGKYYPATREDPEEFPEVVIQEISYKGVVLPDAWLEVFADEVEKLEVQISEYEYPEPDYE